MRQKPTGYDFSGWVTKNDILCTDGRTIRKDAFAHMDGAKVPMVWNHKHDSPLTVLGHFLLENRPQGVYGYGYFNNTDAAAAAKDQILHGDVNALSICANHVTQRGGDVLHGQIKEVSLVFSPANKGAYIDFVMNHSDTDEGELYIYNYEPDFEFCHSDDTGTDNEDEVDNMEYTFNHASEESIDIEDLANSLTDEQKEIVLQILSESYGLSLQHANDDLGELRAIINQLSKDERDALFYILTKDVDFEHDDDDVDYIYHGDADITREEMLGTLMTLTEDQLNAVYMLVGEMMNDSDDIQHADEGLSELYGGARITCESILNTLEPRQRECVGAFIDFVIDNQSEIQHSDEVQAAMYGSDDYYDGNEYFEQGDDSMKYNAFEGGVANSEGVSFTADDLAPIFDDGKRFGSLKESFIAHSAEYGIDNIDFLFPDAQTIENRPQFISRDMDWVKSVLNGVRHTKFSRVKSIYANITEDEARARGYIKGRRKKEEVFKLLKRSTEPQTIYKKQKFDKDDIRDITTFDIVAWVKAEMRTMLDEEIARAILIGDGRSINDDDHIREDAIRPIWLDDELFTIKYNILHTAGAEMAVDFIRAAVKARKEYKGKGNPDLWTTEEILTEMLLLEDGIGHRLYKSEQELATALRVKDIHTVQVMEGATRAEGATSLFGIIGNLEDYNVGADNGAAVEMFNDFDIDYNQEKYLIETRISGAIVTPYSFIAIEHTDGAAEGVITTGTNATMTPQSL